MGGVWEEGDLELDFLGNGKWDWDQMWRDGRAIWGSLGMLVVKGLVEGLRSYVGPNGKIRGIVRPGTRGLTNRIESHAYHQPLIDQLTCYGGTLDSDTALYGQF